MEKYVILDNIYTSIAVRSAAMLIVKLATVLAINV